jgi:DNA-binding response OmpR family regulator
LLVLTAQGAQRTQIVKRRQMVRRAMSIEVPAADVLVISADSAFADEISDRLGDVATHVSAVHPREYLRAAGHPDLIVLDFANCAHDVLGTLMRLRSRWRGAEMIILRVPDVVEAERLLDSGADHAILRVWPVSLMEAWLAAATRRARTLNASRRVRIGDLVYDRENGRVWCASREVLLTPHELRVFDCLWWHAGEVVERQVLHDHAWKGSGSANAGNLVEVFVANLRRKLAHSLLVGIVTVRSRGYMLSPQRPGG